MKDRYDDNSASSDPNGDERSEEEGEIDDYPSKSPLLVAQRSRFG